MDEEIEQLLVSVRADTQGFARDVSEMQGLLDGPFSAGLERVGATLERTLSRAIRTGSLGFENLRNVALSVLSEIANAAIQNGLNSIIGGGGSGGGLLGFGTSILTSFLGAPGRLPMVVRFWSGKAGRSCLFPPPPDGLKRWAGDRAEAP